MTDLDDVAALAEAGSVSGVSISGITCTSVILLSSRGPVVKLVATEQIDNISVNKSSRLNGNLYNKKSVLV